MLYGQVACWATIQRLQDCLESIASIDTVLSTSWRGFLQIYKSESSQSRLRQTWVTFSAILVRSTPPPATSYLYACCRNLTSISRQNGDQSDIPGAADTVLYVIAHCLCPHMLTFGQQSIGPTRNVEYSSHIENGCERCVSFLFVTRVGVPVN